MHSHMIFAGPDNMKKLIHLDNVTGEIVVANKIDHEQFTWLNLTARATDSGVPPRFSLVDLFIQVITVLKYIINNFVII